MDLVYTMPPRSDWPADVTAAFILAYRRYGPQAALRVEDPNTGRTVFRPRYRVGFMKGGFAGSTQPFFIERGAGDDWLKALEDAARQERAP